MKLWESNHAACEKLSLEVLRHLLAKLCLRNFLSLLNCGSPCIANLRYYFKVESAFVSQLFDTFRDIYGVINWFSIDCVAPFSRINFIQCTEPKSIFEFLWVDVVLKDIRFLLCELYIQMFFAKQTVIIIIIIIPEVQFGKVFFISEKTPLFLISVSICSNVYLSELGYNFVNHWQQISSSSFPTLRGVIFSLLHRTSACHSQTLWESMALKQTFYFRTFLSAFVKEFFHWEVVSRL